MKKIFILIIRFYQYFLSPLFGPKCRYYPTCSQYSKECLDTFPISIALWYSCRRILKCNPFSKGGVDPIPKK